MFRLRVFFAYLISCAALTVFTPLASYAPAAAKVSWRPLYDYGLYECLYWTHTQSGCDFAIKTDEWKRSPVAFLEGYPKGKVYTASAAYSPGLRITEGVNLFHYPLFCEAQFTYVPFKDESVAKGPFVASLTLPTTFAGAFPTERIHSSRSLKYILSDLIVRFEHSFACGAEWGAYAGARGMALINKWTLAHTHTNNKGPTRIEWDMKMGNVGGTFGLRGGYQYANRVSCHAHVGGSVLKGIRGSSHLSWNLNTALSKNAHTAKNTPSDRWIGGWDASLQIEAGCFQCFPGLRLTLGYEIQQWFGIPERDHYDFISWHCHQKRSTLTFHGANFGVLFYY